jgi:hypothetical protein
MRLAGMIRFNRGLRLRHDAEETWKDHQDPFANLGPEQSAAERKELIGQQIEISEYMISVRNSPPPSARN